MKSQNSFGEKHSRREFLELLGAGTAVSMLASCEGANKPTTQLKTSNELSGQLVVSIVGNNIDKNTQQALTNAYRQHRPNVQVIWEIPNATGADYPTWLGTQLASGSIRPDIVSGNYVPTFRNYVNFDAYRKMTNPLTHSSWDQTLNWDFFIQRNGQGARIMLPTRSVHIMWFYNKDLFARANVMPPTNWSEFVAVCAKLKGAGITPLSINFSYQLPQWVTEIYFDQYHIDWIDKVRAQPGDWNYDPALDGTFKLDPHDPNIHLKYTYNQQRFLRGVRDGVLRFDTPAVAEIIKNLSQIFPKYATSDLFVTTDTYTPFLQQKTAMTIDGTWNLPSLQNDLQSLSPDRLKELKIPAGSVKPFAWGSFENPPMQGSLINSPVRSVESASGEYLSIVKKNQQQVNLTVDFLMFWTSKPGYQPFNDTYAKNSSYSPGGPLQVRDVQDPVKYQQLFSKVKQTGNAEASYNGEWLSWQGGNIQRDVQNLYKQALQGRISPQNFGTALQKYVTDNFDDILKQYQLTNTDLDNPARQPGS
ncbi:hypothetical protein KDA_49860 [Dictyobacter alpinus]|uniref:ABC transporter substrate-binding protein n=1 Tax=Dictyobacter alpinus TaxID=2014873 RepID=A0A402BDY1_9CHLR|nr:extracellular solute-binding protein [Dictyobacter alpinus]GCE29502.1 hypothetical protein KDA_49860 [Dictyobacter alpinus]